MPSRAKERFVELASRAIFCEMKCAATSFEHHQGGVVGGLQDPRSDEEGTPFDVVDTGERKASGRGDVGEADDAFFGTGDNEIIPLASRRAMSSERGYSGKRRKGDRFPKLALIILAEEEDLGARRVRRDNGESAIAIEIAGGVERRIPQARGEGMAAGLQVFKIRVFRGSAFG